MNNPFLNMIVSAFNRADLNLPDNRYTDQAQGLHYWKVTLKYALIPWRSIDLWFRDEPDARKVGIRGVVPLEEVFQLLAPLQDRFTVVATKKDPKYSPPNQYTGRSELQDNWHTLLWCEQNGRYADLWYGPDQGDQAEANMWAPNIAFGPLNFPGAGSGPPTLNGIPPPPTFTTPGSAPGFNPALASPNFGGGFRSTQSPFGNRLGQSRNIPRRRAPTPTQPTTTPAAPPTEDELDAAYFQSASKGYTPTDFVKAFRVLVLYYPASQYVSEYSTEGFVDGYGYHVPGFYPNAIYPAGFELGSALPLEATSGAALGSEEFLTIDQAYQIGQLYGIPGGAWTVVKVS